MPDCLDNFENGKFMLPLGQLVQDEPWEVRRFHLWYMHTVKLGMKEFVMRVSKEYFHLEDDTYVSVVFHDIHRLLRRKDFDIAQITLFPCKLLHLCIIVGTFITIKLTIP
jgi:hypothetical protein